LNADDHNDQPYNPNRNLNRVMMCWQVVEDGRPPHSTTKATDDDDDDDDAVMIDADDAEC